MEDFEHVEVSFPEFAEEQVRSFVGQLELLKEKEEKNPSFEVASKIEECMADLWKLDAEFPGIWKKVKDETFFTINKKAA